MARLTSPPLSAAPRETDISQVAGLDVRIHLTPAMPFSLHGPQRAMTTSPQAPASSRGTSAASAVAETSAASPLPVGLDAALVEPGLYAELPRLPVPMQRALLLAAQALYLSSPNPRVGCVITDATGQRTLGEGFTQQAGGPHAEVMALRDAAARGHDVRGATAWVTLEPCSHTGRTGPCCDALAAAGVTRVVAAVQDPNPLVAGRGLQRLRDAGITVEIGPGQAQAQALNRGFFRRMTQALPWVRVKVAASLDGCTALHNGQSQWITRSDARADGHAWRARACTVLTGIGTVLHDDPQLNVRSLPTPRQPRVAVLDARLRTPTTARVLRAAAGCLIYTSAQAIQEHNHHAAALSAAGATLIPLPTANAAPTDSAAHHLCLHSLMRDLAQRGSNEVHVEGGAGLCTALLRAGLIDEWLIYLAPLLLGQGGTGLTALGPLSALSQGQRLHWVDVRPVGQDLRIIARNTPPPVSTQ